MLKPGGMLIDLRPAPAHRRVGLGEGRHWRLVGALHELLDDDHAADAAVEHVVRDGYFRRGKRKRFQLERVLDTLDDLRTWIAEFDERRNLLVTHAALLERVERKLARLEQPSVISVRGPMHLAVLYRSEPTA